MKSLLKFTLIAFVTLLISCSNNDEIDMVQRFDRNLTFKIIGEFDGQLQITYSNPDDFYGVTPGENVSVLPWNKSINYHRSIPHTGLAVRGINGSPNQIIQLQIFSNGELIETEFGVTDANGSIYAETSVIYFNK